MPNWCMNSIAFYTENGNIAELKRLHDSLIRQLKTKKCFMKTSLGSGWLGFTAHNHGIDHDSNFCRGEIESVDANIKKENPSFTVKTSTAWSPKMELWEEVCKLYNGVVFFFAPWKAGTASLLIQTETASILLKGII